MTLKLITDNGEEKDDDMPELCLDAIYHFASEYEEIAEMKTDDCLGFTLTIEFAEGIHVIGGSDSYHTLVGQLEDAKQAVILNKMQARMMGDD